MPVEVRGLTQFVAHTQKVVAESKTMDLRTVRSTALVAKTTLVASANPKGLSNFNRGKGITLKARYVVTPGLEPSAIVFPTPPGPWHLLEHGGAAHDIGRRVRGRGARGKRNQSGFLGNPAAGFAAMGPVHHPAAPAKHTWSKASAVAIVRSEQNFRSVQRKQYLKMITG